MAALSIREAINIEPQNSLHKSTTTGCFKFLKSSSLDNISFSPYIIKNIRNEIRRMQVLEQKGLWCDAPPWRVNIEKLTEVSGEYNKIRPEVKIDPHLPLPDDFVSQMGQRSLWLIEQLAPNILRALNDFQTLWKRAAATGKDRAFIGRLCKEYLSSFNWTDSSGKLLEKPNFELRLTTHGEGNKKIKLTESITDLAVWPPKNMSHIFGLARIIQGAHYFIASLSTTARIGESIMFNRSCVVYDKNGTYKIEGLTFKLVKRVDGELRTWTLPPLAAIAIEQQARLVALYEKLSGGVKVIDPDTISPGIHLWGQVGGSVSERSKPMAASGLNSLFVSFTLALGMDSRPGGQLVRSHRFRKTIARLVALALTSAPKVLQDVFGHKSIEMTMYYILTDKDLAAEIDTIAKELRVMSATDVVSKMVDAEDGAENSDVSEKEKVKTKTLFGGYGGPAALRIRAAIDEHKAVVFRRGEDFNASSIRELAEVLTMQGKNWQVVRAGVLCTKSASQSGPCNKKKGKPEPSRCDTDCDFRLEEAWHQQDVDECIAEAVRLYIEETDRQEDLVASLWAGQIRAHVPRFPALKEKWMNHPTVRAVMSAELPK